MMLKLVLLLGAATACTAAPLGSGTPEQVCARGGACVDEEAKDEVSSLIQRDFKRRELQFQPAAAAAAAAAAARQQQQHASNALGHGAGLPDMSDLKDSLSGAVGKVAEAASDAASGLSAGVLSEVADGLSEELMGIETQVKKLSESISTEKESLTSGFASVLAKGFHANITALLVSRQNEQIVRNAINNAFTTWNSVSTSLKALSGTVGTALKNVEADDFQQKLNVSMQAALTSCEGLASSLGKVQHLLPKDASEPQLNQALVRQAAQIPAIVAFGGSFALPRHASLEQASASPQELCTQLNSTFKDANEKANSFANSFADVFEELSDYMVKIGQEKLIIEQVPKVQDSFQLVAKTAKDIGDEVRATSASLFGALGAGVAAAGEAAGIERGAAAGLHAGLLSLLIPALGTTAAIFHHLL